MDRKPGHYFRMKSPQRSPRLLHLWVFLPDFDVSVFSLVVSANAKDPRNTNESFFPGAAERTERDKDSILDGKTFYSAILNSEFIGHRDENLESKTVPPNDPPHLFPVPPLSHTPGRVFPFTRYFFPPIFLST